MPNGGIQPSCIVCKWANRVQSAPPYDHVECRKHHFSVWLPQSHVCQDLDDPYDGSGLSTFADGEGLENNFIYAWLEFQYRTEDVPKIPQYRHELVKLASFQQFSEWITEEKESAFHKARKRKAQELGYPDNGTVSG